MGRSLHKLTAIQAAKLNKPGRHSDGGGLYLSIDESGRRRWVFMYTRAGKRVELGLGGRRDLSLADARAEAATFRAMLAAGADPILKLGHDRLTLRAFEIGVSAEHERLTNNIAIHIDELLIRPQAVP
jgi:Arm DNA-binding domain